MSKTPLGRLEKVDLRKYWQHEATDFTPWLGQGENMALLGEAIDIVLEVQEQEASVGPFRADILLGTASRQHATQTHTQQNSKARFHRQSFL